jgi:hypothetical protein
MINQEIVDLTHNGVCAIGMLTVPLSVWNKDPRAHPFQVVGSGFLVRDTIVMTNRHVIRDLLLLAEASYIPDEQLFISFIAPHGGRHILNTVRMIREGLEIEIEGVDIAFIEFQREPVEHFEMIHPLLVLESGELMVTEEVFLCGYPYGNLLLEKDDEVYRWGPVIQQGYISGLSPFSKTVEHDEILLDVRTAEGMSGSPICRVDTGEVIGIHYAGVRDSTRITTTAYGIPLNQDKVERWLDYWSTLVTIE